MKDNDLLISVFRIVRLHSRLFHSVLDRDSVDGTLHNGLILHLLSEEDGITQKLLAQRMHIRPQSLTGALEKLEKMGFIMRKRSEEDKREQIVFITESGREMNDVMTEERDKTTKELFEILSDEEKDQLYRLLTKVADQEL
ncbi:MAG: MarR family transcriptional regulator [Oscillospiraceae bacterium]|nr:MarR family transcriptional regulator [Oscillospiraceae bacterium]